MRTPKEQAAIVKRRIIALSKKKILRPMSMQEIADRVERSKSYVQKVLKAFRNK